MIHVDLFFINLNQSGGHAPPFKNPKEKKMAIINVTATVNVQRTKTIKIKVRVKDVKDWLRETYGTPSEHGYEWDEPHILEEYMQEELDMNEPDMFEENDGEINETLTDDWIINNAET
jgi:hypothetical protein